MSVEQDAIRCRMPPVSLRLVILHDFAGPLISFPSIMRPLPNSSELCVNETLLSFVSKTLPHLSGLVVHAPSRSKALAGTLNIMQAQNNVGTANLDIRGLLFRRLKGKTKDCSITDARLQSASYLRLG